MEKISIGNGAVLHQASMNSIQTIMTKNTQAEPSNAYQSKADKLDSSSAVSISIIKEDSLLPDPMNITINLDGQAHNQSMELLKSVNSSQPDDPYGVMTTSKKNK